MDSSGRDVLAVIWVTIQKSGAIGKAYNGKQSPSFVDLRGTGNFFSATQVLS